MTVALLAILAATILASYLFGKWLLRRPVDPEVAAVREHENQLKVARKELKRAEAEHAKRIQGIERELAKTRKPKKLGSVGDYVLYDEYIQTPEGSHRLTPEIVASVDTAGNLATKSRSTLTRIGVGTIVAGPVGLIAGAAARKNTKIDTRELYLLIDGGDWMSSQKLDPDQGERVRQFAQQITLAARSVEHIVEARRGDLERLNKSMQAARADRGQIGSASV